MVAESIRRNNRIAREGSPPSPFPPSVAAEGVNTLPSVCSITWADEGTPWAMFRTEDVVYNVDVEALIRSRGL
ncbi:MAG: hypothetical protein ACJ754_21350 [Pyrinomonadaceae bacterium]